MKKDKTNKAIDENIKKYKDLIKKYRKEKRWTQEELAKKLDVALPTIKRYEGGSLAVPKNKITKLFQVLDMQLDDLRDIFADDKNLINELEKIEKSKDSKQKFEALRGFLKCLGYEIGNLGSLIPNKPFISYFRDSNKNIDKLYFLSDDNIKNLMENLKVEVDKLIEKNSSEDVTEAELNYIKEQLKIK
ncbi:helix-turn-helix transcriptional regulator [Fusobacterium nucleatum]|uniref:helix-turn-helix domain-containing protein n=1 Tax=Fusobacterium nucleatum TaxID=851 RepID=UPI0030CB6F40